MLPAYKKAGKEVSTTILEITGNRNQKLEKMISQKTKHLTQQKNDEHVKPLLLALGIIVCILPFIFRYSLDSKVVQVAMGVSVISSGILKNRVLKKIIAGISVIVILYSYFYLRT